MSVNIAEINIFSARVTCTEDFALDKNRVSDIQGDVTCNYPLRQSLSEL